VFSLSIALSRCRIALRPSGGSCIMSGVIRSGPGAWLSCGERLLYFWPRVLVVGGLV
jgi:hypothetical protein